MKSSALNRPGYALSRDSSGFGTYRADYSRLLQPKVPTSTSDWSWNYSHARRQVSDFKSILTPRHYDVEARGFSKPKPSATVEFRDTGRHWARHPWTPRERYFAGYYHDTHPAHSAWDDVASPPPRR